MINLYRYTIYSILIISSFFYKNSYSINTPIERAQSNPLSFGSDVLWYSGSFDPPTIGHINIAKEFAKKTTGPVYITVNHNTGKNFNASIRERIEMLSIIFKDYPNVRVVREPSEGRRSFVKSISKKHNKNVVLAVGEDVLKKNYELLGNLSELSFLSFSRPGQETDYVPKGRSKVYNSSLDGIDGVSSTAVRNALSSGDSTQKLLYPEVKDYIQKNGLYQSPDYDTNEIFKEFINLVQEHFPHFDIENAPPFEFKSTQSKGGQRDAMIRWMLKHANIPKDQHGFYTVYIEQLFGEKNIPLSIHSNQRVGFYSGSFDPMNKGSFQAIGTAIEKLNLDKIYIAPFYSSRKVASYGLQERVLFIQKALSQLPPELRKKIVIIPAAELQTSQYYLNAISKFESTIPIAIYGEDAIERNINMLKGKVDTDFAVTQRSQKPTNYIKSLLRRSILKKSHLFTTGIPNIQSSTHSSLVNNSELPKPIREDVSQIELLDGEQIAKIIAYHSTLYNSEIQIPEKRMSRNGLTSYIHFQLLKDYKLPIKVSEIKSQVDTIVSCDKNSTLSLVTNARKSLESFK